VVVHRLTPRGEAESPSARQPLSARPSGSPPGERGPRARGFLSERSSQLLPPMHGGLNAYTHAQLQLHSRGGADAPSKSVRSRHRVKEVFMPEVALVRPPHPSSASRLDNPLARLTGCRCRGGGVCQESTFMQRQMWKGCRQQEWAILNQEKARELQESQRSLDTVVQNATKDWRQQYLKLVIANQVSPTALLTCRVPTRSFTPLAQYKSIAELMFPRSSPA
jgi:hypothetical protein